MDEIEHENNQEIKQTLENVNSPMKSDTLGTPKTTETIELDRKGRKSKRKNHPKEEEVTLSPTKILSTPEGLIKDSKIKLINSLFIQ